jgi:hypothetical protein
MPFLKIAKQAVTDTTVELVLQQIAGDPVLVVRHLGETNKPFMNDALARAGSSSVGKKKRLTTAEIAANRLDNRETVAKYAIVNLKNVFDDDGKPATVSDITDVVMALPDDVFDTVLRFVSDPDNFRDRPLGDAAAIAGK